MRDRNGKQICVRDFLVTVEEVEIVDDVICSVISVSEPWIKTRLEVAKCVVW